MTGVKTTDDEALTKLSGFDRAIVSLIGLITILVFAALTNAPFVITALISAGFVLAVQGYGRMRRARDAAAPKRAKRGRQAEIFDQRAIADSLSEAVWIISPREQIIYANNTALKLFPELNANAEKTGSQKFRSRRLATVVREPKVRALVSAVLAGKSAAPVDYSAGHPVERHFRVTATPITVGGMGQDAGSGLATGEDDDIKSRKYAMLVFNDVSDLVKFVATQGDFLANASHELKTPIASLLGYIETLRGHAKNDAKAREKFLGIMQEQAERMQRLISDLLSLRQIEQSEHIAPSGTANLKAAANLAIDTTAPLAKARGVDVTLSGPDMQVKGHEDELVQLCLNIIDNAVKMSPKGSEVSITLSQQESWRSQDFIGIEQQKPARTITAAAAVKRIITAPPASAAGYAVLAVSDNGPGFAPQHIPRLGERFYRVAGDRNAREKGTGLGLAIVKHIVRRHRGGLLVQSLAQNLEANAPPIQTGTDFTVLLPLSPTP